MNDNNELNSLYSWPVIILALIFFWPVGLYLIIKRTSMDKTATMNSGKLIGGLGIALYCLAGLLLLASFGNGFDISVIIVALLFGAGGFMLSRNAKKIKKEAASIKQYLSVIVNGNVRQLDTVASSTGKSYETVKNDIQKMINKGYFKNAYINESTREIVLTANNPKNQGGISAGMTSRVVTCPSCGANNTVMGNAGECEYCGSPLN